MSGRRGVSLLLEVIFGIGLFAVSLLLLFGMFPTSKRSMTQARQVGILVQAGTNSPFVNAALSVGDICAVLNTSWVDAWNSDPGNYVAPPPGGPGTGNPGQTLKAHIGSTLDLPNVVRVENSSLVDGDGKAGTIVDPNLAVVENSGGNLMGAKQNMTTVTTASVTLPVGVDPSTARSMVSWRPESTGT